MKPSHGVALLVVVAMSGVTVVARQASVPNSGQVREASTPEAPGLDAIIEAHGISILVPAPRCGRPSVAARGAAVSRSPGGIEYAAR
jgi:hypothetical protein